MIHASHSYTHVYRPGIFQNVCLPWCTLEVCVCVGFFFFFIPLLATARRLLTNPYCSWKHSDQSHTSLRESDQSHALLKESWPILPTPEVLLTNPNYPLKKFDQCWPHSVEFWPISPAPQGIVSNPAHSWRNPDRSCLLPRESWPILPTPEGILSNSEQSWRYSDQYCTLPKGVWCSKEIIPIPHVLEGILTHPVCSWWNSYQSYLLLNEFRSLPLTPKEFWPILPSLVRSMFVGTCLPHLCINSIARLHFNC